MGRAPFEVVVFPFRRDGAEPMYAIFSRSDAGYWQAIAGGGEDDETPVEAARRETAEEAGLSTGPLYQLRSLDMVPVIAFMAHKEWPPDLYVIPQYTFAVEVSDAEIALSHEHTEFRWATYEEAEQLLHWQSNRTALWELNERLKNDDLGPRL